MRFPICKGVEEGVVRSCILEEGVARDESEEIVGEELEWID